eukprot:12718796-Prorocentrum_lima.AAC.1
MYASRLAIRLEGGVRNSEPPLELGHLSAEFSPNFGRYGPRCSRPARSPCSGRFAGDGSVFAMV